MQCKGDKHAGEMAQATNSPVDPENCLTPGGEGAIVNAHFTAARRDADVCHGIPVAILFVDDPDMRSRDKKERLASRYGLTPAEARLAVEIAKGDGKHAAARRCGISYNTARIHLMHIFAKTGVGRQAELARLVAALE